MKKVKTLLAMACSMTLLFAVTAFAACSNGSNVDEVKLLESTEKLVAIEATKTGGSLEDALKSLKKTGELEYEGSTGDFGFYLTSVNNYTPDSSQNEFWAIYSTLGEYEGVSYSSVEYGTYDYHGTICASASYGISGMPLVEGEIYIITISIY